MIERAEVEYVPKELFDVHIQNIRDKASSDKELSDEKFEKFQMILEKNLSEYKTMITEVNGRIDVIEEKLERMAKISEEKLNRITETFEEKLEHTTDTLTVAINSVNSRVDGLEKRIDDLHQSMTLWLTVLGTLVAVVPVAVAVVQYFVKH